MSSAVAAYIALGSNLDNPREQLERALIALDALQHSTLERCSSAYRSPAVGPGNQPDYLNAVARIETTLAAGELLNALQGIETTQGRVRSERWGPRTLDLDLLLYGNDSIDTPSLTVPHPRMDQRDFVLYPLREISDTNLVLPDGRDLDSLIARLPDTSLERMEAPLERTVKD